MCFFFLPQSALDRVPGAGGGGEMSERIGTVAATSLTDDRTEMKCVCELKKQADGGESVRALAV